MWRLIRLLDRAFLRFFTWLFARLGRRAPAPAAPPAIALTPDGFTVRDAAGAAVDVRWAGVRRAAAYKRDLYAADCIMLALELDPPGPAVLELAEDWPGFAGLFGGMEQALGVSPAWYMEIMTPAFEPTPRVLYERGGGAVSRRGVSGAAAADPSL